MLYKLGFSDGMHGGALLSVTRQPPHALRRGPWLCVPASRRVCLSRGAHGTDTLPPPKGTLGWALTEPMVARNKPGAIHISTHLSTQDSPRSSEKEAYEPRGGELPRIPLPRIPVNRGAATLYLPSSSSPQCLRACAGGSAGESPHPPQRPAGSLGAEGIRRTRRSTPYRHPRRPPPGPHAPPQPTRPRPPARQCCPR